MWEHIIRKHNRLWCWEKDAVAFAGTLCRLKQSRLTKIKKKRAGLGYKTILIIFHDNNEEFMTFIFNNGFFFWVCFPLPRQRYISSQSHGRETNACGGCMFLAPPIHNNSEWRCRADARKWALWLAKPSARTESVIVAAEKLACWVGRK